MSAVTECGCQCPHVDTGRRVCLELSLCSVYLPWRVDICTCVYNYPHVNTSVCICHFCLYVSPLLPPHPGSPPVVSDTLHLLSWSLLWGVAPSPLHRLGRGERQISDGGGGGSRQIEEDFLLPAGLGFLPGHKSEKGGEDKRQGRWEGERGGERAGRKYRQYETARFCLFLLAPQTVIHGGGRWRFSNND